MQVLAHKNTPISKYSIRMEDKSSQCAQELEPNKKLAVMEMTEMWFLLDF